MMKTRHFLLALLLLVNVGSLQASPATSWLLPKPQQMTENGVSFDLGRPVGANKAYLNTSTPTTRPLTNS